MPVPTIFLIGDGGEIVEMTDQAYDSEALLQELLAKYPTVLAGDQMSGSAPLKWLLVAREAGIPDQEGGADRWSLDHVFIDQGGIPTLVEVKRRTDTRIRREVVGQMLDYAANAVLYWPVETIRQRFEETCRKDRKEPGMVVSEFIGVAGVADADARIAQFWNTVETNLRAGKIRLIFAADEIPPELKRVVEFLNEQMNPAEVLAIEIRQYVGTGVRTLVPSVIRSSKRAATLGVNNGPVQWDRKSFINDLRERQGAETVAVAERLLEWASTNSMMISWGRGRVNGLCFVGISHEGVNYYPFAMWTSGFIQLQYQTLLQRGVALQLVEGLASELKMISGIKISPDGLKSPAFEMAVLKEPEPLSQFLKAIWAFLEQINKPLKAKSVTVASA